jgi:hypothetical protein
VHLSLERIMNHLALRFVPLLLLGLLAEALSIRGDRKRGQDSFLEKSVAVGMALSGHPPHRSVREELPHTALTLGE